MRCGVPNPHDFAGEEAPRGRNDRKREKRGRIRIVLDDYFIIWHVGPDRRGGGHKVHHRRPT